MKTVWMYGAGAMIAAVAAVAVLMQSDEIDGNPAALDIKPAASERSRASVPVTYRTSETIEKHGRKMDTSKVPETKTVREAEKRDPHIRYQGTDDSGRYGFQVIDVSTEPLHSSETVGFVGEIDGNRFVIRIPKEVRQSDLHLRIVDRKTKEEKSVPLPFAAELGKSGYAPQMKVSFDDAENYEVVSDPMVASVFP